MSGDIEKRRPSDHVSAGNAARIEDPFSRRSVPLSTTVKIGFSAMTFAHVGYHRANTKSGT